MKKDPLLQLVKSPEWMDGYKAGLQYGIQKERKYPQVLRFGVEIKLKVKSYIVKKFSTFQEALDWADWNYKLRRDIFTIKRLKAKKENKG